MYHWMRSTILCLGLVAALLVPQSTAAKAGDGDTQAARRFFRRARKAYTLGQFERALELFKAAYEAKPMPAFLFNLGQCHWQLKNYERAIFFYEGYIREKPDAQNRPLAEELLAESRRLYNQELEIKRLEDEKIKKEKELSLKKAEAERLAAQRRLEEQRTLLVKEKQVLQDKRTMAYSLLNVETAVEKKSVPAYKKWWFWTIIGSTAAATAATVLGLTLGRREKEVMPERSLGTIEIR